MNIAISVLTLTLLPTNSTTIRLGAEGPVNNTCSIIY